MALSFSWVLYERVWVERMEGWVDGRFLWSWNVTLGERSSSCSWAVWFSSEGLDGTSRSSEVVFPASSDSEELSSGGSAGE